MANSNNTMWTVGCICFSATRSRHYNVRHMDGRSYRSEKNARDRYDSIIKYLKEDGYSITKIPPNDDNPCEGVQARKTLHVNGQSFPSNYFVFIDYNPPWNPG